MKKLTQEEFENKLLKLVGNNISILSEYKTSRDKSIFKCNTCNHEWSTKPNSILNGTGCPECGKIKSKETKKWNLSTEDFFNRLPKDVKIKVSILSEYNGIYEPINVRCNKCGKEWKTKPINLKRGHCCIKCGREENSKKTSLTQEEFENKVYEYHGDAIKVLSRYISGSKEIEFLCNDCGKKSKKKEARILLRRGCSNCVFSKGEKKIQDLLEKNLINFEREYRINDLLDTNSLRFDFAVFKDNGELSHLIEYDGQQHFKPVSYFGGQKRFEDQIKKDKLKNEYCTKNNIKLIRIKYDEFDKINIKKLLL